MRTRIYVVTLALAVVMLSAILPQPVPARPSPRGATAAASSPCDRECLYGFLEQYVKALLAKDPSKLPLARNVKYTENNVAMEIGDGMWNTITGLGPVALKFADVKNGQAGYYGVLREADASSPFAFRLKVENGKITEIEADAARPSSSAGGAPDLDHYVDKAVLRDILPPEQRTSREKMIALARGYFDTLQQNDGTLHTEFDDACNREENGIQSTNNPKNKIFPVSDLGCADQFRMGYFRYDDRVRDRRYLVLDEERGLIMTGVLLDHSGKLKTYKMTDGRVLESSFKSPSSLYILELFKIRSGKILQIAVVMTRVPYNMPSVWPVPR
jgi:hypothetical protein